MTNFSGPEVFVFLCGALKKIAAQKNIYRMGLSDQRPCGPLL